MQIRYRQNTKKTILVPVTISLIPPTLTNALAILFHVRTTLNQADTPAKVIDLQAKVTNALEKGVIGLEIEKLDLDSLGAGDEYYWDILVVAQGALRSASAVDGDVFDAVTFDSPGSTFMADAVVAGDYLVLSTGTNIGSYKIAADPVIETQLIIEALPTPFPDIAEGAGQTFEVRQAGDPLYYPEDSAPFEVIGSGES